MKKYKCVIPYFSDKNRVCDEEYKIGDITGDIKVKNGLVYPGVRIFSVGIPLDMFLFCFEEIKNTSDNKDCAVTSPAETTPKPSNDGFAQS